MTVPNWDGLGQSRGILESKEFPWVCPYMTSQQGTNRAVLWWRLRPTLESRGVPRGLFCLTSTDKTGMTGPVGNALISWLHVLWSVIRKSSRKWKMLCYYLRKMQTLRVLSRTMWMVLLPRIPGWPSGRGKKWSTVKGLTWVNLIVSNERTLLYMSSSNKSKTIVFFLSVHHQHCGIFTCTGSVLRIHHFTKIAHRSKFSLYIVSQFVRIFKLQMSTCIISL